MVNFVLWAFVVVGIGWGTIYALSTLLAYLVAGGYALFSAFRWVMRPANAPLRYVAVACAAVLLISNVVSVAPYGPWSDDVVPHTTARGAQILTQAGENQQGAIFASGSPLAGESPFVRGPHAWW